MSVQVENTSGPLKVKINSYDNDLVLKEYMGNGFALWISVKNEYSRPISVEELELLILGLQQILRRKIGEMK